MIKFVKVKRDIPMSKKNKFCAQLEVDFPLIMAPMFLVSNLAMMQAGIRAGIMATFPSLNYRKEEDLGQILQSLKAYRQEFPQGNYGVNLIVQKSNPFYRKHLEVCVKEQVPFYITSLGNPNEVIAAAHAYGAKVYCDVTNLVHAKKCLDEGCDGFIAVGQGAGGHAGPHPLQVLIPALRKAFPNMPVVGAGGIATGEGLLSVIALDACAASVGTRFIASTESSVTIDYKNAIVNAGMDDIIMSSRLSGTPSSIINTEEARRLGTEQNFLEKWLSNHSSTKKYFKMFVQMRGMKKLEESILPNNYKRLWSAGKSSALVEGVLSCEEIVKQFRSEYDQALEKINATR